MNALNRAVRYLRARRVPEELLGELVDHGPGQVAERRGTALPPAGQCPRLQREHRIDRVRLEQQRDAGERDAGRVPEPPGRMPVRPEGREARVDLGGSAATEVPAQDGAGGVAAEAQQHVTEQRIIDWQRSLHAEVSGFHPASPRNIPSSRRR